MSLCYPYLGECSDWSAHCLIGYTDETQANFFLGHLDELTLVLCLGQQKLIHLHN